LHFQTIFTFSALWIVYFSTLNMLDALCPSGGYVHSNNNSICARMSQDKRSWDSAKAACEESGDTLLVLDTLELITWFKTQRKTLKGI